MFDLTPWNENELVLSAQIRGRDIQSLETFPASETARKIWQMVQTSSANVFGFMNERSQLEGFFFLRDLVDVQAQKISFKELRKVAKERLATRLYIGQSIIDALNLFEQTKTECLPVFQGENFQGVIYQKDLTNRLNQQKPAQTKSQIKSERFNESVVSALVNELRTPLSVILIASQDLASHKGIKGDSLGKLGIIKVSTNRCLLLAQSLSDLEKGKASKKIERKEENLFSLLTSSTKDLAWLAKETKDIHVTLDCNPKLTAEINSTLIQRIIQNLLDNAIKYGIKGQTINIRAEVKEVNHRLWLFIFVGDKDAPVGQEFTGEKCSDNKDNCGLGLSIVKQLCELQAGRLNIEKQPDLGYTVSVKIPVLYY